MKKNLHPQIAERKLASGPINYRAIAINAQGELVERESNLDKRIIEGYAVIYGEPNMHREIFLKGAYEKTIREHGPGSGSPFEIKFNHGHNVNEPLALFDVLEERDLGLYFRTKPLEESPEADKLIRKIRSGLINNFSQEFLPVWEPGKVEYNEERDAIVFKEVKLFGIGAVGTPSDTRTFAIRSAEDLELLNDETEDFIKSLPRKFQLEARQLFTRHKSLGDFEPLKEKLRALEQVEEPKPDDVKKRGINYSFLIKNL